MSKAEEKKEEMARKMGKHSKGKKQEHGKYKSRNKAVIEGDFSKHLGPEDKFSKKDVKEEIKDRKVKNGPEPKDSWLI